MIDTTNLVNTFESKNRQNISIAVIGDICLDHYYFIDPTITEKSVETGLETISVEKSTYSFGGAGNVAYTCKRLGVGTVDLYGVTGDDFERTILLSLCDKSGIGKSNILKQTQDWHTNMYHKFLRKGKEMPRLDLGNNNKIDKKIQDNLLSCFKRNIDLYDIVIINEQLLHGIMNDEFVEKLNDIIVQSSALFVVDTRNFKGKFKHVIYKMNDNEATSFTNNTDIKETILNISKLFGMPVVVTLGKNGAVSFENGEFHHALGIDFTTEIDTVGAGDAFVAAMSVALALRMDLAQSVEIGNFAASASVLHLQCTGNPTVEELIAVAKDPLWRYHSEIAESKTNSNYVTNSQIEIVDSVQYQKIKCFPKIAIFDNDGTISVLRQGWESVMATMMEDTIVASDIVNEDELELIKQDVMRLISLTTGIQTIAQMQLLIPLIKKYGHAHTILDAKSYKAIYLNSLKKQMEFKMNALNNGELDYTDLTIKDSVSFLKKLHDAGTRIYLASGTDQNDVLHEATLLGYAYLFEGRIRGSVGDPDNDPKKIVIENIIKEIEEQNIGPEECTVFGDGPVEMREARKHGFLAIGVLSDEKQRFGANWEKRSRLILSGADVLIPDFSQIHRLYKEF